MSSDLNRRNFLGKSLAITAGTAVATGLAGTRGATAGDAPATTPAQPKAPLPVKDTVPTGKIGNLQVSRLIMGSNLITFFTHSRDLRYVSALTKHYNTPEKIVETFEIGEQHGVNAIAIHNSPDCIELLNRHRKNGGKMQWVIGVQAGTKIEDYEYEIGDVVEKGANAIYLHGNASDMLMQHGRTEMIGKIIEIGKKNKVPTGVGTHDIRIIEECEKNKWPIDFYVKTFHHLNYPSAPRPDQIKSTISENPGYWCKDPDALIALMKTVEKPWIAFKVMAAGAITPKDAFTYVYKNGADHILAGMFDFQIPEDVRIAKEAMQCQRERPWRS